MERALVNDLLARLVARLDVHERVAIAVSGGVDSMTLAHVAFRYARARPAMYHAGGPAVPEAAGVRVRAHAERHGWPLVVLDAGEFSDGRYRANPVDRCYYCKSNLYARIRERTRDAILSGTNRDDLSDFRPGLRAADEAGVFHPYVAAGIDKAGVYAVAAALGLSDLAQLPAQPCLASRVETGIAIAAVDLAFIDATERRLAEALGHDAVLRCRVTHRGVAVELAGTHDPTQAPGALDPAMVARALEIGEAACRAHGRTFVGVRPYRQGSAFVRVAGPSDRGDAQSSPSASAAAVPPAGCAAK